MANQFLGNRMVAGTFSIPANPVGNTSLTLSQQLDHIYIPTGAIVTRIGYLIGAQTEIASFKDATMQLSITNIPLLSNNVKASVALSVGVVGTGTAAVAGGVYVGTGGPLKMYFASSDNARSGISANGTIHIGYIKA
jgi:hypothetical protein